VMSEDRIRQVIRDHDVLGRSVKRLDVNDDLFAAGMTSHSSVNLMLALENEFQVEFPDRMLTRAVFKSIGSLTAAIEELMAGTAETNGAAPRDQWASPGKGRG
jgi:acyl carrier protein